MSFFDRIGAAVRRRIHERDIENSLAHFERWSGQTADAKEAYSDSGTFRAQVDRLFALGNAAETTQLKQLAEGAVAGTMTNRFYRAADYLSDVVDELERHTYLTGEPTGEPPLEALAEGFARELKLKAVIEAWMVPLKIAAVESAVAHYSRSVGRALPYAALQRFERNVARLFALAEQSESVFVGQHVERFVNAWSTDESTKTRFQEPALAIHDTISCLCGNPVPDGIDFVRARRADAALRLATAVPEDRQHYLRASFARWGLER